MMPPWMIAELEKEKAARESAERRPELRIEIPRPPPGWVPVKPEWVERKEKHESERGVWRIEF